MVNPVFHKILQILISELLVLASFVNQFSSENKPKFDLHIIYYLKLFYGEFVSRLLTDYAGATGGFSALGDEDASILERIDSRLARIEKQLGLLLAER